MTTPSPLRKDRKSGFLTPSISLKFWDTKISQTTSFPYYFNIAEDKELTFTFAMILLVVIGMSVWFYDADQLNQAYYEKHRKNKTISGIP